MFSVGRHRLILAARQVSAHGGRQHAGNPSTSSPSSSAAAACASLFWDRFFSSDNSNSSSSNDTNNKPPAHKQIVPPRPDPPAPRRSTIVEPPIRSRPFRSVRKVLSSAPASSPMSRRQTAIPQHRVVAKSPSVVRGDARSFPVQAVHVAQSIDMAAVISKVFATKGARRMLERLSVVVQLPPSADDGDRFVAVFRFGSVVFFNVSPKDANELLTKIKKFSVDPVLSGSEFKENFCVHVQPEVPDEEDDVVTGEFCVVQELNMKSVDVISNIMAQSVALDSYNEIVDEVLTNFEVINGKVTKQGNLSAVDREKMFQAVAKNNTIFIEMISRVGIKDRIDTAWNLSQYEEIHDGMKEEFDIDGRFSDIEFKLNVIQENAKFFLGVLAHQKSDTLEWIIIVLIAFECILMCMEMSGTGERLFEYLGFQTPSQSERANVP